MTPEPRPNQIRSLNLIREFLGGRGNSKLVNLVRLRRIRFSGLRQCSAMTPDVDVGTVAS